MKWYLNFSPRYVISSKITDIALSKFPPIGSKRLVDLIQPCPSVCLFVCLTACRQTGPSVFEKLQPNLLYRDIFKR